MRVGDAQSVDKCEPSRRSYARVVRRACERVLADDARGWQEHLAPANDDAPGEVASTAGMRRTRVPLLRLTLPHLFKGDADRGALRCR